MSGPTVGLGLIARVFLGIGAMSYGGPAIMGIMQAEIQEKRRWIDKPAFTQGLALVGMLPGPGATQLAIYIGHARAGLAGGIVAGLAFIAPAFVIMLALASLYAVFGALPALRGAFYGIGPVVVGIFAVAVYRLAKGTVKEPLQLLLALAAAVLLAATPLGVLSILLGCGCAGIALFHSRRAGTLALALVVAFALASHFAGTAPGASPVLPSHGASGGPGDAPGLGVIGAFFLKVGAFAFGGGLSMIAFIQDQVVDQLGWLTAQEFLDGLALGQLTPGPILMVAAFVGYKLAGIAGAAVAAGAIFLPSFLMMLMILPLLQRMVDLGWLKAFMRGAGAAVIGTLAVSLAQMTTHAATDPFGWLLLGTTVGLMLRRGSGPLSLMLAGGVVGWIARHPATERLRDFAR